MKCGCDVHVDAMLMKCGRETRGTPVEKKRMQIAYWCKRGFPYVCEDNRMRASRAPIRIAADFEWRGVASGLKTHRTLPREVIGNP